MLTFYLGYLTKYSRKLAAVRQGLGIFRQPRGLAELHAQRQAGHVEGLT
jgi:hypothetical protein